MAFAAVLGLSYRVKKDESKTHSGCQQSHHCFKVKGSDDTGSTVYVGSVGNDCNSGLIIYHDLVIDGSKVDSVCVDEDVTTREGAKRCLEKYLSMNVDGGSEVDSADSCKSTAVSGLSYRVKKDQTEPHLSGCTQFCFTVTGSDDKNSTVYLGSSGQWCSPRLIYHSLTIVSGKLENVCGGGDSDFTTPKGARTCLQEYLSMTVDNGRKVHSADECTSTDGSDVGSEADRQ
eukprot:TRINITY_DN26875_c0_g1_i1.p1 TRINITY_DN26875_c0_g1~~TRINITY_DN26875_c0_g1_i1.p1  ORF type:complete len:261 (+),score=23.91 TRINITY_DN26875_c0_g1_i1:91-783(+)